MKRIAIFCDGTWNRADAAHATNVVKLAQAMSYVARDGTFQQMFYVQGVGTGRGTGALSRLVDRLGGGAFGWGLVSTIEEAYRALAFSYQPGDEIYIFGFSRGAFTARSLAGLIRSSAIPARTGVAKVPKAINWYRSGKASTHPDTIASFQLRLDINPDVVTSPKEATWRRENRHRAGLALRIAYIGVWDTVEALGVPRDLTFLAGLLNGKYRFHNAALSSSVRSARHAVAIDENRRTFPPALWDNLRRLNAETTGDEQPYSQMWFAGVHGSVGGGGDVVGLSNDTLMWIVKGAQAMGLEFENDLLQWFDDKRDPMAPLDNKTVAKSGLFASVLAALTKHRAGPISGDLISDAARSRWSGDPNYRPKTLAKVNDQMYQS